MHHKELGFEDWHQITLLTLESELNQIKEIARRAWYNEQEAEKILDKYGKKIPVQIGSK